MTHEDAAVCAVTSQPVVSGRYATFATMGGEELEHLFFALEFVPANPDEARGVEPTYAADLDDVVAAIASLGRPGVLRWNPKTINGLRNTTLTPKAPVRIPLWAGDKAEPEPLGADAIRAAIIAGAPTPVDRVVELDGDKLIVTVAQRIPVPFEGVPFPPGA